ncbi:hypothetical protein SmJEL517_g01559 [Synchytrium microbalum]|uniref:Uncharacterized protein n=1 Tax=Synchytrium microbalum TaxID=1806994 RepID=A0A507CEM9_9FUNG|nr:uncharacterized protein SmJEL517_g01559 [Synchytrium microbalum]TPX36364.1 hypothetical protein SmJEL517_g01559 [Synchytrium microbalum]
MQVDDPEQDQDDVPTLSCIQSPHTSQSTWRRGSLTGGIHTRSSTTPVTPVQNLQQLSLASATSTNYQTSTSSIYSLAKGQSVSVEHLPSQMMMGSRKDPMLIAGSFDSVLESERVWTVNDIGRHCISDYQVPVEYARAIDRATTATMEAAKVMTEKSKVAVEKAKISAEKTKVFTQSAANRTKEAARSFASKLQSGVDGMSSSSSDNDLPTGRTLAEIRSRVATASPTRSVERLALSGSHSDIAPALGIKQVKLSDFEEYLKSLSPVYPTYTKNRPKATKPVADQPPTVNLLGRPKGQYNKDIDRLNGQIDVLARLGVPAAVEDHMVRNGIPLPDADISPPSKGDPFGMSDLTTIPDVFTSDTFDLRQPNTFALVLGHADPTSQSPDARASSRELSTRLTNLLTIVDGLFMLELNKVVPQMSDAAESIRALVTETKDCFTSLVKAKASLKRARIKGVDCARNIVRLERARGNALVAYGGVQRLTMLDGVWTSNSVRDAVMPHMPAPKKAAVPNASSNSGGTNMMNASSSFGSNSSVSAASSKPVANSSNPIPQPTTSVNPSIPISQSMPKQIPLQQQQIKQPQQQSQQQAQPSRSLEPGRSLSSSKGLSGSNNAVSSKEKEILQRQKEVDDYLKSLANK